MKLKKNLVEEVKLTEDEAPVEQPEEVKEVEPGAGDGIENVGEASHEEIVQEVEASSEKAGDNISKDAAEAMAQEIEDAAKALMTKATDYAAVNSKNPDDIINMLNACLESGLERWTVAKQQGSDAAQSIRTSNLLIYGMPGFGKTAAVKAWCKSLGIYLLSTTMSTLVREVISGIPWPEMDEKTGRYIQRSVGSELWEPLWKYDKVVVFLDELNTSKKDVESAILAFVAEHVLPTVTKDEKGNIITQTVFDNILFFVGAENPADPRLFANHEDSEALADRFNYSFEQKGDRKEYLNVLKTIYNSLLANPYLSEDKKYKYEGQFRIGETLMKDKNFYWDTQQTVSSYYELAKQANSRRPHAMNYRTLSQLLFGCNGTKVDFLRKAKWSDFAPAIYNMLSVALASYVDKPKQSNTVFNQGTVDPKIQNAAASEVDSILQQVADDFKI